MKTVCIILLAILLAGTLIAMSNVQPAKGWSGTVYIRADGSIEPPDAPIITYDNVTYILIGNITNSADGIMIERDNIVIDGADYSLYGTRMGIVLFSKRNVIIENFKFHGLESGIKAWNCSNIIIHSNKFMENEKCIDVYYSNEIKIFENEMLDNTYGISIGSSWNNDILFNNITMCWNGIWLHESSNNTILENTIHGAFVSEDFSPKESVGVDINGSNNSISENLLTYNAHAIVLCGSSNIVSRNKLISNLDGVWLYSSNNNVISENEIKNCTWDVFLIRESYENRIFHNNIFQDQTPQLGIAELIEFCNNIWDDGYPSGGNYWSTYNGTDTNSDGIGDTQYIIDKDNTDRYPLVSPYSQNFIPIDKMPPTILVLSPENKEYYEKSIPLIFKISEQCSWIGYSLDRQSNITITGNTTLKELSDGKHNLVVYAEDKYGNIGVSQVIWFSVNSQENIKKFLLATATIAAVIIIIAFVIYKRKSARKHSDGFQSNSSFSHR
jgi:parallel beta-helix repeat protein